MVRNFFSWKNQKNTHTGCMDRSRTESINVSEMMGQRDPGPPV